MMSLRERREMARVELPTTPPSPRRTRISFLRFHPPTVQKAYRARSKRAWHTSADTFCTGLGCDTWGLDHPPTRLTPRPGHNFLSESSLGFSQSLAFPLQSSQICTKDLLHICGISTSRSDTQISQVQGARKGNGRCHFLRGL